MLVEITQFIQWIKRRNPNARTWRDYSYDLNHFVAFFGDVPPNSLTFQDIDRYINDQVNQGYRPSSINRHMATIFSFYNFLSDEDQELICPVLSRRHHLRQRERLPRPIQEEKLRTFFYAIDRTEPAKGHPDNRTRDRAMFLLMLRCGLRIGEVASLQLSDLFLNESYARLIVYGKGSLERIVFVSPQSEWALRAYLIERPLVACDAVFLSYQHNGLSTTAIHKRLMLYRKIANIAITAHRLRHSFANGLLDVDVPVTSIQKLLGHRWLESTQLYVQANDHQVAQDYYAACAVLETW